MSGKHTSPRESAPVFQPEAALAAISRQWDEDIVGQLREYIAIPAKSPMFEQDWQAAGQLERVVQNAAKWIEAQHLAGLTLEIVRIPGRTPLLLFEIAAAGAPAAAGADAILMYGHLDKQPESTGWREDLGPWSPKYEDGRLYGRGAADDGYAVYAAVSAVQEVQRQQLDHPRIIGIIETSEESGSVDLPAYLELLRSRIGAVGMVVCLDSGAGNYDQLWLTSSLRGNVVATLRVEILTEGVHSGDASGIVPSSMRIMRQLLDRLEDSATGRLLPEVFHCEIPADRLAQARATAEILGAQTYARFPWVRQAGGGSDRAARPVTDEPVEALLQRSWRPALSVIGAEGLPPLDRAGNVLRPMTALKLSIRTPPTVDTAACAAQLKALLQDNAPYQARVTVEGLGGSDGWNAPAMPDWLSQTFEAASRCHFGAACAYIGQGGSIPLIGMLRQQFPDARMMVCGVLGPGSNAHGPNEFLHVPYVKKLTACVAQVIAGIAAAPATGEANGDD